MDEAPTAYGGAGWIGGDPNDYDREYCVDLAQLSAFLRETQTEVAEALALGEDGPTRRRFLARLQGEITKRGTIDVLRHGIKHGAHDLNLFYGTPSPGNEKAKERLEHLQKIMDMLGIGRERLRMEWMTAAEGDRFASVMREFTKDIKKLGPSPLQVVAEK